MKSIVFIACTLFLKTSVVLAHDEQTCLVTAKTDNPYINLKTENGGPTNKIWFRGFGIETDAMDDFNPLIEEEEKRTKALTSFMDHVLIHNPQLMERYFLTFAIQSALNGLAGDLKDVFIDKLEAGGIENYAEDRINRRRRLSDAAGVAKTAAIQNIQEAVDDFIGKRLSEDYPLVEVAVRMKTLEGYQPQVNDFGRRFGMVDSVNPVLDNAVNTLQDIVEMSGTSNRRRLDDADAAVAKTAAIKNIQKELTARILKHLGDNQPLVEVARKMKAIENMQPQINDMDRRTAVIPELNRELSWIGMTLEKGIDVRGMGKKRRRLSEDENMNEPSPSANIMEDVGKYIKDAEKEIHGIYGKNLRATSAATAAAAAIKNIQKALTAKILKRLDDGQPLVEVYRKMKAIEGMQPQINDMERRLSIIQSVEPVLDNANRHLKTLTDVSGMGKKRRRLSGDELEMAFSSFIEEEKEQEQRKGNYETRWQATKELAAIPQKMKAITGMQPQINDMERRLGIMNSTGPVLDDAIGKLEEIVDERRFGIVQGVEPVFGEAIDHLEKIVVGQNVKDVSGIGKRRRLEDISDDLDDLDKNMIVVLVNPIVDSLKVLYNRILSQHPVDIDSSSETNDVSPVKDGIDEYYFGASPPHGHKDVSATIQNGEHGEKENIAFCKKPKSGVENTVYSEDDVNIIVHGGSALQRAFVGKRMRHISRLQQKVKNMERRLGILQSVEPILEIVIKHLQKIVDVRGMGRRLSSNKSINTLLMHTTPLIKSESEKYSALEELANNMKALESMQFQINELERRLSIMYQVEPVLENAIETLQQVVNVSGMGKK